jgi:bicarbonate transport system ATP-binding protein
MPPEEQQLKPRYLHSSFRFSFSCSHSFYPTLTLPDVLGRGLDFPVSPQYIGGIKGGKKLQLNTLQTSFGTGNEIYKKIQHSKFKMQDRNLKSTNTATTSLQPFLEIKDVCKVYPTKSGPFTVLDGVNLNVEQGEFLCVIGHSGCGKSTLLNIVSGFNFPTTGQVLLEGQPITKPGPDRMVVFQNYALLPWRTAFENIYLAVNAVYPTKPEAEKRAIVRDHLTMVGLGDAMEKKPMQMSGGMRQRVSIARALAIRPKVLILDEPFGALDAITKEELQEELLKIWGDNRCTVLMITHDIDEALFLADKLVMMTNGPHAKIGEVMDIPFSRPRDRARIMEDPQYYQLRNYALDFLFNRFAHDDVG